MVNIRPRRLMTIARRNSIAKAIKTYVVGLVTESGSTMAEVRDKVRTQKGVSNLTPAVCEEWAVGLGFYAIGMYGFIFSDAEILQFTINALGIKYDELTDDCLFNYGRYTYTYDLQEVVDFYWSTLGKVVCWC